MADTTIPALQLPQAVQADFDLVQDKTFRISWQATEGAEFYRVLENPDGLSGFSQVSNDLESSVLVFDHRVALHRRFNASYIVQSCNSSGCVDSETQTVSASIEQSVGYFKASNTEFEELFGSSVSLSSDGKTLAVAASGRRSSLSTSGSDTDAVYVFERDDESWVLQAVLTNTAGDGSDGGFGSDVSLSADGNTLVIGSANLTASTSDDAVYLFERSNGAWQQQAYLKAGSTDELDFFGSAVSLGSDGNTLAVGVPREDGAATGINGDQIDNSSSGAGAVYIFERVFGNWQQLVYLKASNTGPTDLFGSDVSLSLDGNTLAVGATDERSLATGVNGNQSDDSRRGVGAVYLY